MPRLLSSLAALAATLALAGPANAATISAVTSANVVKPVLLSKLQDMDFGTLTFAGFTGTRTIVLSRLGAVTCAVDIVCSGVPKQARFNVQGTNNNTVLFSYSGGTLSNGIDSIPFTPNGPANMAITNSGAPGTNFDVGGSLTISPTLVGGTYSGTMTVTADYQ
jgi:spore coat protein U-like protein